MTDIPNRAMLRYHGGKWALGPWIISHFPKHDVFVDCYGGGGSITLHKPKSKTEVYNDLWSEIVNAFRVVRDPERAGRLKELLYLTPFAREELLLSCEPSDDPLEQARRTLVRSWFTFTPASFATGESVTFAASFDDNKTIHRIQEFLDWQEHLDVFTRRLRTVLIENMTAVDVIKKYDTPTTLFYVDPPYVHDTRIQVGKGAGYAHEMTDLQHMELAYVLNRVKGSVILSGYHSKLYDDLYKKWEVIEKETTSDRGQARVEVLWLNKMASLNRPKQISIFDGIAAASEQPADMVRLPSIEGLIPAAPEPETVPVVSEPVKLAKNSQSSLFDLLDSRLGGL
jgi:DNA adenine methylase